MMQVFASNSILRKQSTPEETMCKAKANTYIRMKDMMKNGKTSYIFNHARITDDKTIAVHTVFLKGDLKGFKMWAVKCSVSLLYKT